MVQLFMDGGFPMWFLLACGLAMIGFAGRFAATPLRRTLRITLALGGATFFTTLAGMAAAFAKVGHFAAIYLQSHPNLTMVEVLLQGTAESLSAAIFGFPMLSLAGFLLAFGFHREAGPAE
jgi:hypothetical protein